jgi:arylsulfatase A-like enzyme
LRDFASEATVCTRAIATSDWTLTTHASMFTGLYPRWHGAYFAPPHYRWGRPLAERYTTLAEVLRAHGYWTAAEVANYGFLSPSLGLAKGFTIYHARRPIRVFQMPWERRPFYLREGARRVLSLAEDTAAFDGNVLRAEDINRRAFELLDRATHNEQPFFLFLNYMDAHGPYVLPSPFDARFPGRDPHFNRVSGHIRLTLGINSGQRHISAAERRHVISQYDGAIAYEDEEIGKLLARLHELGCYDNTLIIITSDHGELFGQHDLMGHNVGSVYQDLVHVPLLVKYPGQHDGRQSDTLVSQVDLMPTVLDLAGISPPPGVQGQSLRLPRADSDAVYTEAIAVTYLAEMNPRFRGVRRGIFAGTRKLTTWTEGRTELYDLAADPGEARNLYRTDDPGAKALERQLSAWAAAAPRDAEQPGKLDKNSVERLKSLGYAQ